MLTTLYAAFVTCVFIRQDKTLDISPGLTLVIHDSSNTIDINDTNNSNNNNNDTTTTTNNTCNNSNNNSKQW